MYPWANVETEHDTSDCGPYKTSGAPKSMQRCHNLALHHRLQPHSLSVRRHADDIAENADQKEIKSQADFVCYQSKKDVEQAVDEECDWQAPLGANSRNDQG